MKELLTAAASAIILSAVYVELLGVLVKLMI
jgi:hypothetical protein